MSDVRGAKMLALRVTSRISPAISFALALLQVLHVVAEPVNFFKSVSSDISSNLGHLKRRSTNEDIVLAS